MCISILHDPGADQYGYEDAGERWLPVHGVESIVRLLSSTSPSSTNQEAHVEVLLFGQLVSVISLLSSDTPNTDSPANVDAAKEVREDIAGYRKCVHLFPSSVHRRTAADELRFCGVGRSRGW